MRYWFVALAALGLHLAVGAGFADAGLIKNGDFALSGSPVPDWSSTLGGAPTATGGVAVFVESSGFSVVQLEQGFTVPANALLLTFDYKIESVAGGTLLPNQPPDSFQAVLYDSAYGNNFPGTGNPALPAYYAIDNTGFETKASGVTVTALSGGWNRVTLNISSLFTQDRIVEFVLNGADDGRLTTAYLDNVDVTVATTVVPVPGALVLLATGGPCLLGAGYWRWRRAATGPRAA